MIHIAGSRKKKLRKFGKVKLTKPGRIKQKAVRQMKANIRKIKRRGV